MGMVWERREEREERRKRSFAASRLGRGRMQDASGSIDKTGMVPGGYECGTWVEHHPPSPSPFGRSNT